MKKLIFYGTEGCHLCDLALQLIVPVMADSFELEYVDISSDDLLMARYGVRIPVVKFDDGDADLGWPFTLSEFLEFSS